MSALSVGELFGRITADDSGMRRGLANAQLRMRGFRRDMESNLREIAHSFREADWRGMFDGLGERAQAFGRGLGRVASMAAPLGGVALSIGRIAAMLGVAAPAAAGLAAALANIAPAAGLAATGIIAVQLAANALKLGMVGVGDAVKAALDPSKAAEFEEAVKKLAPEAQKFARVIKSLAPQFKELQQTVQNRLFKGFDGVLKGLAKDTLPVLRTGLMDAADSLNAMGKGVGESARSLARNGTLGTAIAGANAGLRNLSRAPGQMVTALTQIGAAAAPAFGRLTASAGRALDQLSQRLSRAFQSGAMQKAIETAISLIGDLADVAANIGSIFSSVFGAAQASGGGLIGVLKEITGALADAFASKEVQAGLQAIYRVMAQVAKSAAPILVSLLRTLSQVFATLGPPIEQLVKHLGAGLLKIADALGPVLVALANAFGALVVAALPLIDLAADLIAAVLPALTPLFQTLAGVIRALTPFIQQLAQNVAAQLLPVLTALATRVLPQILPLFVQLAEQVFPMLTDILVQLGPSLSQLGVALAELLVAVAPVIVQILSLSVALLTQLMPVIQPLITLLARLASGALMVIAQFISQYVVPAVQALAALLRGDFSGALNIGKQLALRFTEDVVRNFTNMKARAGSALQQLGISVARSSTEMGMSLVRSTMQSINRTVGFFHGLPGRIRAAMPGASSLLFGIGAQIIRGLISGVRSQISSLASTFKGITNMIPDLKGPESVDKRLLVPAGQMLIQGLQRGVASQVPALRAQLGALTGDLPGMAMGAAAPPGVGAAGGVQTVRIVVDGPEAMVRLFRVIVADRGGGSVQRALGYG